MRRIRNRALESPWLSHERRRGILILSVIASVIASVLVAVLTGVFEGDDDEPAVAALPSTPTLSSSELADADMDFAARLVTGPGAETSFRSVLPVQDGNVVQFQVLANNLEPAQPIEGFKFLLGAPDGPARSLQLTAEATGSNLSEVVPGYKSADTVQLRAATEKEMILSEPRDFKIQRNISGSNNIGDVEFDEGRDLPSDQVQIREASTGSIVEVTPLEDGLLTSRPEDIVRIGFLVDVN